MPYAGREERLSSKIVVVARRRRAARTPRGREHSAPAPHLTTPELPFAVAPAHMPVCQRQVPRCVHLGIRTVRCPRRAPVAAVARRERPPQPNAAPVPIPPAVDISPSNVRRQPHRHAYKCTRASSGQSTPLAVSGATALRSVPSGCNEYRPGPWTTSCRSAPAAEICWKKK